MRQLSEQFLECARRRATTPIAERTEGDLRRATSDLYYALFHALCGALVEPMGVNAESAAFREPFLSIYRLPEHGFVEKRCRDAQAETSGFSDPEKRFAKAFVSLKNKRTQADYDPLARLAISTVRNDIQLVESVLAEFWAIPSVDRVAFAYYLAVKGR